MIPEFCLKVFQCIPCTAGVVSKHEVFVNTGSVGEIDFVVFVVAAVVEVFLVATVLVELVLFF